MYLTLTLLWWLCGLMASADLCLDCIKQRTFDWFFYFCAIGFVIILVATIGLVGAMVFGACLSAD